MAMGHLNGHWRHCSPDTTASYLARESDPRCTEEHMCQVLCMFSAQKLCNYQSLVSKYIPSVPVMMCEMPLATPGKNTCMCMYVVCPWCFSEMRRLFSISSRSKPWCRGNTISSTFLVPPSRLPSFLFQTRELSRVPRLATGLSPHLTRLHPPALPPSTLNFPQSCRGPERKPKKRVPNVWGICQDPDHTNS